MKAAANMSARLGAHPVALAMAPKVSHADRLKASMQAMPRPVPKGVSTGTPAEDKKALELSEKALKLAKQYQLWVKEELIANATTKDPVTRKAYENKMVQVFKALVDVDQVLREDVFYFSAIMSGKTAEQLFFNMVGNDVAQTLSFLRNKYGNKYGN